MLNDILDASAGAVAGGLVGAGGGQAGTTSRDLADAPTGITSRVLVGGPAGIWTEKSGYPLAKAFLERVREEERKVSGLEMRIENLRMLLTGRTMQLSDLPRGDSPDQQRMQTVFAEIDTLEREKAQAEAEAEAIRIEVGRMICRVSDPSAQKVLMMHYLENMQWIDIAGKIGYCRNHVYRIRARGYAEIEKMLHP